MSLTRIRPRVSAPLWHTTRSCHSLPLLILLLAIAGLVLGKEAAQGQLFGQINSMVGPEGAKAIEAMIAGASKQQYVPASSTILVFAVAALERCPCCTKPRSDRKSRLHV